MSKRVGFGEHPVLVDANDVLWRYDEEQKKYVPVNIGDVASEVVVSEEVYNLLKDLKGGTLPIDETKALYSLLSKKPTKLLIKTRTGLEIEYLCSYTSSSKEFKVGLISCFDIEKEFRPCFTCLSFDILDPSNITGHIEDSYIEARLAYLG